MHCLEVLCAKNERAAGREAGHALNQHDFDLLCRIFDATTTGTRAFNEGYAAGQKES